MNANPLKIHTKKHLKEKSLLFYYINISDDKNV